jgi:hypothetical protein
VYRGMGPELGGRREVGVGAVERLKQAPLPRCDLDLSDGLDLVCGLVCWFTTSFVFAFVDAAALPRASASSILFIVLRPLIFLAVAILYNSSFVYFDASMFI